jgi:hypothetical protein
MKFLCYIPIPIHTPTHHWQKQIYPSFFFLSYDDLQLTVRFTTVQCMASVTWLRNLHNVIVTNILRARLVNSVSKTIGDQTVKFVSIVDLMEFVTKTQRETVDVCVLLVGPVKLATSLGGSLSLQGWLWWLLVA